MSAEKKQFLFEVRSKTEQKPFENPAVRSFFYEWCKVNDSIRPRIISREEWEQKSVSGLLEKRPDGMQDLFIPQDLQLWEMVKVMEAIDRDTFADQPEKQAEKKEELFKLGGTFTNAGVYIAQRLDAIPKGKEAARVLAEDFFEYGQSLAGGKKPKEKTDIGDMALHLLDPEEVAAVDRFLAGENLYAARQARADKAALKDPENRDKIYESERQKTLAQFFRVAAKAPAHSDFLRKVNRAMEKQIATPHRELVASVFRRGMELLRKNMPFDELPNLPPGAREAVFHWENGEATLREALGIEQLKTELEEVRQTGDLTAIGDKEREITNLIQGAVSGFSRKAGTTNPSEIVVTQSINCVGASMLGGTFLAEVGIKYLVGHVPHHSILVLAASDGKIEWRDMLYPDFNEEITDEVIEGKSKTGAPLTTKDIFAYANNSAPEGLMFDIKGAGYRKKIGWVKEGKRQFLTVFPPEIGQKIEVLYNVGKTLSALGREEEALEAYRQASAVDPKFANLYHEMGVVLTKLGRNAEAVEAYRQASIIDPENAYPYFGLGMGFFALDRKKEAAEAYRRFITLADKNYDGRLVKSVERLIKKLQREEIGPA